MFFSKYFALINIVLRKNKKKLPAINFFVAPFFEECINEQDLDEMNIEIIRNTLYKAYLESFYNFCKNIGGETEEVMCEILAVSIIFWNCP